MVELNLATNQLTKIPEDVCGLVSLEVSGVSVEDWSSSHTHTFSQRCFIAAAVSLVNQSQNRFFFLGSLN